MRTTTRAGPTTLRRRDPTTSTTTRNSTRSDRKTTIGMNVVCLAVLTITTCSASRAILARGKVDTMNTAVEQSRRIDVTLECQATRVGTHLVFSYHVTNGSDADVYVMDAVPSVDPSTR